MIPHRDRLAQIQSFTEYLQDVFTTAVRGAWLAQGIWQQCLVASLVQAGIEYTLLDDFHFERPAPQIEGPFGYYLTESDGHLLKVFPACPALANGISFVEPALVHDFLSRLAQRRPGSTVVFALDSSELENPPGTASHIDPLAWLERFCEMITSDGDWLEITTLAALADRSLPLGKVFPSDSAYRWRNDQSRRPEADEMYARMLGISERLAAAGRHPDADPDFLEAARLELHQAQCSSAYHATGPSGLLELPYLRNAVYAHLISAHNALDEMEGTTGPRVRVDVRDFNFDARQEVRLENDCLIALARPARGGHIYELDLRAHLTNALATLDRPREDSEGSTLDHPAQPQQRINDPHPRKALVDHFFPVEAKLEDLVACRDIDCGDFALGTFQAKVQRQPREVALIMERAGRAGEHTIRLRKTITLAAGEPVLSIRYEIAQIPADACLHFAVEFNLAGMPGQPQECSFSNPAGITLGPMSAELDLPHEIGLLLTDHSSGLSTSLAWSQSAGLWSIPIETLSHRGGGIARVHQSSAVIPHWHITPDETGRWEVSIQWAFEPVTPIAAPRQLSDLALSK